jgi:hypothetical protein
MNLDSGSLNGHMDFKTKMVIEVDTMFKSLGGITT